MIEDDIKPTAEGTACDGKTPLINFRGSALMVSAVNFNRVYGELQREIESLRAELAAVTQQAQIWKQEAMTQKATVHECYQACTGATGEPGDWHGADPVRNVVADRDAAVTALTHISKTIGKQLNLIEERAPGKFLDKPAVVSSLKMHKRTCDAAIKGEAP